jgi:hypothetical protein
MTRLRSLLSAYIAEYGGMALVSEVFAMATVFVLIGGLFVVTPASVDAPATPELAADGSGRGAGQ